jgi:FdhD protein
MPSLAPRCSAGVRVKAGRAAVRVAVVHYRESGRDERDDRVAAEEPLEVRIAAAGATARSVAVTMRTPGNDEELAVGFLFSEGFIAQRSSVAQVAHCAGADEQHFNVVEVRLAAGADYDATLLDRNFLVSSSCGVCGKASLDALAARGIVDLPAADFRIASRTIHTLPARLREAQGVFERTGGLHAAGLFDAEGARLCVREDVGRHNAVDKVVGWAILDGSFPLDGRVLVVSGRASFEILQKVAAARIPVLVAVGAPSSLAVQLARRFGVTLIGFARDGEFNVYAGAERLT